MDILIDARSSEVTVDSTGKDGKEEVKTDHLDLPLDLANGMVPMVVENLRSDAQKTTVFMVVATPKPRFGEARHLECGRRQFFFSRFSAKGDSLWDQDRPRWSRWRSGAHHWQSAAKYSDLDYWRSGYNLRQRTMPNLPGGQADDDPIDQPRLAEHANV
jgi:hypothetical protein